MIALTTKNQFSIIALSKLLENYGEEWTQTVLSAYQPIYESATESYLHEKAIEMEKRDASRTYVALSDSGLEVLGYFTLSIRCMRIPIDNLLSGKTLKRMNIEKESLVAQSYLIGQLSRSANAPKGLGATMLDLAFDIFKETKMRVGCRVARLDCHDELLNYYISHGFKLIQKNDENTLNQMMAFV